MPTGGAGRGPDAEGEGKRERNWSFTLDRFERCADGRTVAVLLFREPGEAVRVELPSELLPEAAGEGSVLRIDVRIDYAATQEARGRVGSLLERLTRRSEGGDGPAPAGDGEVSGDEGGDSPR